MSPKLTDQQEDTIEKLLRHAWVLGLGGVAILVAVVFLLHHLTPPAQL